MGKNNGQKARILEDLLAGIEVDMLKDIERYGTSCRSRIAELRAAGYPIQDYFKKSSNGARYKVYYLTHSFLSTFNADEVSA